MTAPLPVDGCTNFRDAGGWATTDGRTMRLERLYRSDDPIRLTDSGRASIAVLGLAFAVDLRQMGQFVRSAGFLDPARTLHRPLVDRVLDPDNPPPLADPEHVADLYERMIETSRPFIAEAIDALAEHLADGPVLVHCAYGKDRTGIVVAIIQAALGVPAAAIAEEYGRSDEPVWARRQWLLAEPRPDDPVIANAPPLLFRSPPAAMAELLRRAEQTHGSLAGWVASFPLAPGTVDRLRAALLA